MDDRWARTSRRGTAPAAGLLAAALLLGGAPAQADEQPVIVSGPTIAGVAQEGQTLSASADYIGEPAPSESWTWLRCSRKAASTCTAIAGATLASYEPGSADVGGFIRVQLTVRNAFGENTTEMSSFTEAVLPAAAPTPTPTPTETPTPTPTETPTATPTGGTPATLLTADPLSALAPSASGGGVLGAAAAPRMLRPFPIVRIRGRLTPSGARVTLLSVRAPRGVMIAVRCLGPRCPTRRWARAAAVTRARPFERSLLAGVRLVVQVTRPGWIGKHTRLRVRRGRPPARSDRCLYPGSTRPRPCPA